ncbi:MAG: ABC transporter permease [Rhizobiales bacterium 24-66-13]|jgi:branched-chain amino acid transport system substrate-binding protein|uniref:ABC transporter substrate-binding protein n=1 Tax=Roseixanthobacter finlandensis TaxID=3119922 RepID=UPI000BD747FC|nr:MAG: ABC transporter permease [Azorhizobium sp. 12-66-6]OYY87344.1 MAG: ABC transporter permease [Rhizobiales bacterium 35-66-30]OYZ77819.1 MAG: ABC transporter permease [Rhizobiales bacterium 24-66-13]OZB10028.1 MAG: ABC transporter permease [Rhizobiales bacterium 39-66-18]HQS09309.1 ABC transporter substrate-binding protein [Xanthobacteraceae bacterium]
MKTKAICAGVLASLMMAAPAAAQYAGGGVKIGVLTDMSGAYSDLAGKGSVEAARLAIEDFGKPINGKPVELVSADHQNKADVASTTARAWYDTENVDAIFDINGSVAALAVRDVAKEKGKVDINSGAASMALTNKACSATGLHWTYDVYSLAAGTGNAVTSGGGKSWYFITADYTFGHDLEQQVAKIVKEKGGTVKGAVRAPFNSSDFSSYLLQAQASGAQIIGMANAGADTINTIKQAREFGITQGGQTLAALLLFLTDIKSVGLDNAQGMVLTTGFYWDLDDKTRAFSKRFAERMGGKMPTMVQAGVYSSVLHYLKAAEAAGTDEGVKVVAKMRELPIDDMFARNGKIRADGRMVHDMYLAKVKKPEASKGPWDFYEIVRVIPGDEAFQPLSESTCPLVKK